MIETNLNAASFTYKEYLNNSDMSINQELSQIPFAVNMNSFSANGINPEHRLIEHIHQTLDLDDADAREQNIENAFQLLDQGISESAFQLLDQGISENPSYPGYFLLKGKILFHLYDLQAAIAYLSKAIEMDSHFSDRYFTVGEAQYWRGRAYIVQMNFKNAYADLKSATDLGNQAAKQDFESLFSEDNQWIFGSRRVIEQSPVSLKEIDRDTSYLFSRALELFTESEQAVRDSGAHWTNRDILQKNCEAIAYVKEAISQNSNDPSFYILLGKLYMSIFENSLAIKSLSQAVEIDSNFSDSNFPPGEAIFQIGMAYFLEFNKMMSQKNFKTAIEQFDHEKAKLWLEMTDYLK